jgi:hypothetical protein
MVPGVLSRLGVVVVPPGVLAETELTQAPQGLADRVTLVVRFPALPAVPGVAVALEWLVVTVQLLLVALAETVWLRQLLVRVLLALVVVAVAHITVRLAVLVERVAVETVEPTM